MTDAFVLDKIEVRSSKGISGKGVPKYYIKGTAVAPEIEHVYQTIIDPKTNKIVKSFKSLFTQNAVESIKRQFKSKRVFFDALHEVGSVLNSKKRISEIKNKVEDDSIKRMLEELDADIQMKKLPMFRGLEAEITDKGLEVSLESNPHFAEVDDEHARYYNAVTKSLLDNYIDGMSLNFSTVDYVEEDGVKKINDVELYGLSLVPGAALGPATNIAEVAMRSIKRIERDNMTQGDGNNTQQTQGQQQGQQPAANQQAQPVQPQAPAAPAAQGFSQEQVANMVNNAVQAALQKQQQQSELEQYKQQVQELTQRLENNSQNNSQQQSGQTGSRGLAVNPPSGQQPTKVTKEMLDELSYVDLMRLQAEFPGSAQGKFAKVASHTGRPGDPRAFSKVVPLPSDLATLHRQLLNAREKDGMTFTGLPTQ